MGNVSSGVSKVILNGETLIDVTQKTVSPSSMLSGVTALQNNGEDITGNIASKTSTDLIASGATVTAPAGYYASNVSKSIDNGSLKSLGIAYNSDNHFLRVSGGVQTSGYLEQQNKTAEFNTAAYLPTQAAVTITPTESEQTAVEQYKWTTGIVKVGAISSTYVGSEITRRSSADLTASGSKIIAPSGYYAAAASKVVSGGSATTPAKTISAKPSISFNSSTGVFSVSVASSSSITPTVSAGYISSGTAGTVTVSGSSNYSLTVKGSSDLTTSGSNVTVPSGYYPTAVTKSVAGGAVSVPAKTIGTTPTISVGNTGLISVSVASSSSVSPNVTAGYVSSGIAGTISVSGSSSYQLSTQGAQTIHPATSSQTIANGKYLTGTQTIEAVTTSNLIASNIKSGVTIKIGSSSDDDCVALVTGTYEGTGGNVWQDENGQIHLADSGYNTVDQLTVTQNGTYTNPSGSYNPVIVNVSGGGGDKAPQKQVNFIDYDGTLLYSYTKAEINAMTSESDLPSNPSHTGLTAQGWNWTLAQIKAQLTAMPDGDIWVGQMYVTTSGATEIDIVLDDANYLSPYLAICVNGTCTVDWGDDSATDTMTGTSETTVMYQGHTYASTGSYTIKIASSSGTIGLYAGTNFAAILSATNEKNNKRRKLNYSHTIKAIRIGTNTSVKQCAFAYCSSLTSLTIPSNVTSIGTSAFYNCYTLASLTIPSGVTSIGDYMVYYCLSLTSLTISSGVTSIGNYAFSTDSSLASLTIPSGVTSIGNSVFANGYGMEEYHFQGTTPPTLGTTAFSNIQPYTKIYVPYSDDHSVLEAYKTATNWSTYASYMEEEPT